MSLKSEMKTLKKSLWNAGVPVWTMSIIDKTTGIIRNKIYFYWTQYSLENVYFAGIIELRDENHLPIRSWRIYEMDECVQYMANMYKNFCKFYGIEA